MTYKLRDESTPEGKAIWADVDKAASRAPEWIKKRLIACPVCEGELEEIKCKVLCKECKVVVENCNGD